MRIQKVFICLIAALIAVLAFFRLAEALRPTTRRLARDTGAPYGRFLHLLPTPVANFFTVTAAAFREQSSLLEERNRYRDQAAKLEAELLLLRKIEEENRSLRRKLQIAEREPRLLAAEVLSTRAGDSWMNRIRIDKGSKDGVDVNSTVLTEDGLVGRVISVTLHTADILLLTDAGSRLSCTMEGNDAIRGILCGNGIAHHDKTLLLTNLVKPLTVQYLHKDAKLTIGTKVVTSGLGGLFPAGIPIGEIRSIEKDASGLFLSAQIVPYVDFASLRSVFVVRDSGLSIRQTMQATDDDVRGCERPGQAPKGDEP